ncbi:MAG: AEC family transporter [Thermodesulforhabdaceae bacterium]
MTMLRVFVDTILPLFLVIILGFILNRKGILGQGWAGPANKITYYIAVPAILFKSLVEQDIRSLLSLHLVIAVIVPILVTTFIAWFTVIIFFNRLPNNIKGTFIHSSIHGNIGYMAYAVSYYALGERLFSNVVIFSSILILVQNIFGVIILTLHSRSWSCRESFRILWLSLFTNPIIISVFVGIVVSLVGLKLPVSFMRLIKILSDMGLPTALILVGAGLVFGDVRHLWKEMFAIGALKLVFMPLLGALVAHFMGFPQQLALPLLILLASPTATVTYVMATQLGGSPSLASAVVSVQTIACALSYSFVLGLYS